MTKDEIISQLYQSSFIEDLIWKITSGHELKDDLKSELFLILCEMDSVRILRAHNGKYLHYLCVNILKKQYHSKTSPFHTKWRKDKTLIDNVSIPDIVEELDYNFEIIDKVIWFVENRLDFVDKELFKLYFKIGKYDRWLGELRDLTCEKPISSLRKVEKKLAITTIEGKKISIGYDTIRLSLNRSMMRIKHYLKENDINYN